MSLKLDVRPYIHLYMPNELTRRQTQANLDSSFQLTTHSSLASLVHAVGFGATDGVILPSREGLLGGMIRERENLYTLLDRKPNLSKPTNEHLDAESELHDEDGLQQDSDDECAAEQTDSLQTKTCYLSEHPELGILIVVYDDTAEESHPFALHDRNSCLCRGSVRCHPRDLRPSYIHTWLMMQLHFNSDW